jgi:ABC-type proline/glycine betaine transport system ATPase subunit
MGASGGGKSTALRAIVRASTVRLGSVMAGDVALKPGLAA